LYVGILTDPTPALLRVDTSANAGLGVKAMNLAQAVTEYGDMKFPPPYPALHGQYGVKHVMHEAPEFAGHAEQTAAPVALEYFATPQFVHAELLVAADVPAPHTSQVDAPDAPENVPATQAAQDAFPAAILYVPERHCVQLPPFAPEKPALQVHAASAELEIGELELAGHARHVVATVAATTVEYFATAQVRHANVPETTL
jgi:hypothetical protein